MRRRASLIAAAAILATLLTSSGPVWAQATATVSPTDPVYQSIERLIAAGLVRDAIIGQRPMSRREIARVIHEATNALSARESTVSSLHRLRSLEELLATLRADYADELALFDSSAAQPVRLHTLDRVNLDWSSVSNSARPVPADNGIGAIDAWVNPLGSNRQGRLLRDGSAVALETSHRFEFTHVAISLTPRLAYDHRPDGSSLSRATIQDGELRLVVRNVALEVGRQYLVWGQGKDVGLLTSNNSPGLDLIEISNDTTFLLPSFLRRLGRTHISLFYADLGVHQDHPDAYLAGYKLSFLPTSRFEFGATVYTKSGGRGAPSASLSSRILDLFPFINRSAYGNVIGTGNQDEFSDRYAGLDARLRFPHQAGVEAYTELLLNDFDVRRIGSILWQDAGHVFGILAPTLGWSGETSLLTEFHHTGIRYYEHYQFRSGQTVDQVLTGDPLGPDALGAYLDVARHIDSRHSVSGELAWECRSNDQYAGVGGPNGTLAFKQTESRPKETRYRAVLTYGSRPVARGLGIVGQIGIERTLSFGFVHGSDRWGSLARLGLEYRF